MSASRCLTAWKAPMGWPNATRMRAYALVMSRHAFIARPTRRPARDWLHRRRQRGPLAASPASARPGVPLSSMRASERLWSTAVSVVLVSPAASPSTRKMTGPSAVSAGTSRTLASAPLSTGETLPVSLTPSPAPEAVTCPPARLARASVAITSPPAIRGSSSVFARSSSSRSST